MTDIVTSEVRSRMMSGIGGKNTKPEILVRKGLHAVGFRFRLHASGLPGKPDLLLPRYRAAIFIHGCFWHGHDCHLFRLPGTRPDFWLAKISENSRRDSVVVSRLLGDGWRVGTVWECALRGKTALPFGEVIDSCACWLRSDVPTLELKGKA